MNVSVLSGVSRNEGGLFNSVRGLSLSLSRLGVAIDILSHIDNYTKADVDVWQPLNVSLYSCFGPLKSSFKLRRILNGSGADLLHVHGIWLDRQWAALQWQKKTGKPVLISPRGMLDPWAIDNSGWKKKWVGAWFANESLKTATCLHALCKSEADSIRAYGLRTPVAVIPNGVDLPNMEIENQEPKTDRRKNLLFIGRIHPKKGLSELIQAWKLATDRQSASLDSWRLIIAGWDDGGHLDGLKQLATKRGISWADGPPEGPSTMHPQGPKDANLLFCGPVFGEKKDSLLRSADAFILPSFSEGFPMSVLEGWSYGLPVLMTDSCNIPEGFSAEAALHIDPNPESIAQCLDKMAAMPEADLQAMGSKGRKLVEQKFTWDNIAREMKQVYEWCLSGGTMPNCILND